MACATGCFYLPMNSSHDRNFSPFRPAIFVQYLPKKVESPSGNGRSVNWVSTPGFLMKTITHSRFHRVLTKSEEPAKPNQELNETSIWVFIGVLAILIMVFAYLFWNKV